MKEKQAEAVAQRIVDDLFVNGEGKRATRLAMEMPGKRDGGGWNELAVMDRVKKVLMEL